MKRLLVFVVALSMFCGCAQNKSTAPVVDNISFAAEIYYGDQDYSADVSIVDGVLNLTVTAPEEIDGLTLKLDENGIKANFKGITFTPDTSSLPQGAISQILFNVLNDAKQKTAVCGDENCEITGTVDGYKYTFVISPSGLPIELEVVDLDFKIEFTNVTLE